MSLIVLSRDTRSNMKISDTNRAHRAPLKLADLREIEKQFGIFIVLSIYQLGIDSKQKFTIYGKGGTLFGTIQPEYAPYFSFNNLRNQIIERNYGKSNVPIKDREEFNLLSIYDIRKIEAEMKVYIVLSRLGKKQRFTIYDEDEVLAGEINSPYDDSYFTSQTLKGLISGMEAFNDAPGL